MSPIELQQVRSTPLFAGLTDAQLGCLEPGEVIEVPAGAVLGAEGERTGFFHVLLEGEVRITRTYDRQSILMAVTKPGNYLGETMLLLDNRIRIPPRRNPFQSPTSHPP
ncbi:cyclic nucleotide-binding domain-containing protein [Pedosphaera parvula]|nr:cyclic nucleotide-binding domain-containing protein [Pedosphaera parvula]